MSEKKSKQPLNQGGTWSASEAIWRTATVWLFIGAVWYFSDKIGAVISPFLPAEESKLWTIGIFVWMTIITGASPFVMPIIYLLLFQPQPFWSSIISENINYNMLVLMPATAFTVYWVNGSLCLLLDCCEWPGFLARRKIQAGRNLVPKYKQKWWKLIKNVVIGQITGIGAVCLYCVYRYRKWGLTNVFDNDLPSHKSMALHFTLFILIDEILFFYIHWAFHTRLLFPFHKIHHEYNAPIALAASYSHPLENLTANVIPFAIGPILTQCHGFTFFCFMVFAVLGTQFHHSGYKFPWHMIDHQPEFHDFHHERFNYNFGNIGLLDIWHKTDLGWKEREAYYKQIGKVVVPTRSRKREKIG